MAKKPTIQQLQQEIEALRRRVAELEARPPVVIHNHPPAVQPQTVFPLHPAPAGPGWWPKVGEVWCGTAVVGGPVPLWNGPRTPDGSCGPIRTASLTARN